jgi:hypothetical protein
MTRSGSPSVNPLKSRNADSCRASNNEARAAIAFSRKGIGEAEAIFWDYLTHSIVFCLICRVLFRCRELHSVGSINKILAVVETLKSGDFRVHVSFPVTFVICDTRIKGVRI